MEGLCAVGEDILFKFRARERRKKYMKRSLRKSRFGIAFAKLLDAS
jgi:hypothetical protein